MNTKTVVVAALVVALNAGRSLYGLSVNVPLVGRVTGAGGVVFATALDVSNNASSNARVDFYFDGKDVTTGESMSVVGSLGSSGLTSFGGGVMSAASNQHFDDFIASLVASNFLPANTLDHGIQGSVLFTFGGYSKSGQGAVAARFYNAFGGGNVGVAIRGHEITTSEPQKLVVVARDTTATAAAGQTYPNLFINNTGLAPDGSTARGDVSVQVSAVSVVTHSALGAPVTVTIGAGQTVTIGHVFQALGVTPGSGATSLLVYANVVSGNAAIEGLISQVDAVTKDGSAFEMSRADF